VKCMWKKWKPKIQVPTTMNYLKFICDTASWLSLNVMYNQASWIALCLGWDTMYFYRSLPFSSFLSKYHHTPAGKYSLQILSWEYRNLTPSTKFTILGFKVLCLFSLDINKITDMMWYHIVWCVEHLKYSALKMKAAHSCDTLVHSTRLHSSTSQSNLYNYRCMNLNSYNKVSVFNLCHS
jgi:hypothetical protein